MKSLVILISGRGSNMEALLDANLAIENVIVISSNPHAKGLRVARKRNIKTVMIDHRAYLDRAVYDATLAEEIDRYEPDLIALAGFMRVLSDAFVHRYQDRLINIHPSLLPAFPGLHTHKNALQEGVKIHGCTVHFVTPQVDHGPIVIQAAVSVLQNDTEETLAARVLQQEHRIYPQAVRWFIEGRLKRTSDHIEVKNVALCNTILYSPGLQE